MSHPDQPVNELRARLALVLLFRHAFTLTTFWAFCWGTVVLLLRATTDVSSGLLLCGAGVLPLAVVAVVVLARRQLPSASALRALLDRYNHLGGVLMATEEVDIGPWRQSLRNTRVPQVRWDARRAWALFAAALAFLVAGFLVPQRFAAAREAPLEIGPQVQRVKEQVQLLEDAKVLEPARAEEIKSRLDQMREESRGRDPGKALEALDNVEEMAKALAREAAEAALQKTEKLARTAGLADALRRNQPPQEGGLNEKSAAEALQELARQMRDAMKDIPGLAGKLDPATRKALEEAMLSPEQLKKVRKALEDTKEEAGKTAEKLAKAGLIDPEKLKDLQKAGKADGEALLTYLKENQGKKSMQHLAAAGSQPGQGSPSRGPGEADISFGKESPDLSAQLKEVALPQARLDALKESKLSGVSPADPKKDRPGGQTTSGSLREATAGSGSAQTEVILPRHRGAVERYFERRDKK